MFTDTLLLLWLRADAMSSRASGSARRYSNAKIRPWSWDKMPEVAAAVPSPSTKMPVALSSSDILCV